MQPRSIARRRSGGRPSKGDRKDVRARPERATAELIDELSLQAGATITDYAAALLRIGLQHLDELPDHLQPKEVLLPEAG